MSITRKVTIKDGKVYHEGKPVEGTGKFYLIKEGTFEEILSRIRERNTSQDEIALEVSDEMKGHLPPSIKVGDFVYVLDNSIGVLQGKCLWVRYKTLEEELNEALEVDQNE